MKYRITLTDTFCGEANFSWARKAEFEAPETASDSLLIRRAKNALGIVGKHKKSIHCETIELRFPGYCLIAFIEPLESFDYVTR